MAQARKALAKKSRSTAARMQSQTYTNYIGGRWVPSASSEWIENRNPADTRDVIGRFSQSKEKDVDEAVAAAAQALETWRQTPAPRRAEILFSVGEILIRDYENSPRH